MPLHLPRPSGSASVGGQVLRRSRGRRRRQQRRLLQVGKGLLLGSLGIAILVALVRIPERLDALLLVSHAIANLILGLHRLAAGLLQLGAVLLVVLLALLALLLVAGGLVRLWRGLMPPGAPPPPTSPPQPAARSRFPGSESDPSPPLL
jgi:hypothetical protein